MAGVVSLGMSCSSGSISGEASQGQAKVRKGSPLVKPAPARLAQEPARPAPAVSSLPRLEGAHRAVFDLRDNRMLAHLMRDNGLFIPLGLPGVAKYLNFGRPWKTWTLNQRVEGRRVALAKKSVTALSFPLTLEQAAAAAVLSLRLLSPKGQGLRVNLNNKKQPTAKVSQGWQTVRINLAPGSVRAGENYLQLHWGERGRINGMKSAAAVEWVHLGQKAISEEGLAPGPLRNGALHVPNRGGLAYYVSLYAGSKLRLAFTTQDEAARCRLSVRALLKGKPVLDATREEQTLPAGSLARTYVDLAPAAGKVHRLELTADGEKCAGLSLKEAAMVLPGPTRQVKRSKKPRNVLFWLIDNARADRYKAYNPKTRVQTPVIDELIKTGTVFTNAYIQGTESRVSHASIWTGLYPKQARFINPKAKLSPGWVTLSEAARKAGLLTAAWIANGFVSKFWGFSQGFDLFRNTLHKGGGLNAEALAGHAIQFIKARGDKGFYLYVGTIDPHVSWRGRQPWLKQYFPKPYSGEYKKNVWGKDVAKMATGKRYMSPTDRERVIAIYDSTVSYNDQHLGRVLQALQEKGIRDETMIVITADHGEELWDFGRIGHGHSCRHALVAVPLIIHYPPLFGAGVRVEEGVDVVSVMPSILDALGQEIPPRVQGESLLPLAQGVGRGYPRPSFATQYEFAHTMKLGRWKIRVGGKGVPKLFDMDSPRGEHRDVAGAEPGPLRWLTDSLSTFVIYQSMWRSWRWGVASNHKRALPEDLEGDKAPETIKPF